MHTESNDLGRTVGERIETLRKRHRLSRRRLSQLAGVNETYVRDLVNHPEREPRVGNIEAIAQVLGVAPTTLWPQLARATPPAAAPQVATPTEIRAESGAELKRDRLVRLRQRPNLNQGTVGAGLVQVMYPMPDIGWPAEDLAELHVQPETASVVVLPGDAMAPLFVEGDRLLIDEADRKILSGRVYAVEIDGVLYVRRLEILHPGGRRAKAVIRLIPENPRYAVQEVDAASIAIVGQIRACMRLFPRA